MEFKRNVDEIDLHNNNLKVGRKNIIEISLDDFQNKEVLHPILNELYEGDVVDIAIQKFNDILSVKTSNDDLNNKTFQNRLLNDESTISVVDEALANYNVSTSSGKLTINGEDFNNSQEHIKIGIIYNTNNLKSSKSISAAKGITILEMMLKDSGLDKKELDVQKVSFEIETKEASIPKEEFLELA